MENKIIPKVEKEILEEVYEELSIGTNESIYDFSVRRQKKAIQLSFKKSKQIFEGLIDENKIPDVCCKCLDCGNITELGICLECGSYNLERVFIVRVEELKQKLNEVMG